MRTAILAPRVSDSVSLEWELIIFLPHVLAADADSARQAPHFENNYAKAQFACADLFSIESVIKDRSLGRCHTYITIESFAQWGFVQSRRKEALKFALLNLISPFLELHLLWRNTHSSIIMHSSQMYVLIPSAFWGLRNDYPKKSLIIKLLSLMF